MKDTILATEMFSQYFLVNCHVCYSMWVA